MSDEEPKIQTAIPLPEKPPADPPGGLATFGSFGDEPNTRETRMMERAVRDGWPVKPEHRQIVVDRMVKIVSGKTSKNREAIAAAKALVSADKVNIEREKIDQLPQPQAHVHAHAIVAAGTNEQRNTVFALAQRLGLGEVFASDASGPAAVDAAATGGGDGDSAGGPEKENASDADAEAG